MSATLGQLPEVRADFPILDREINGSSLVYLDSAATSQTPRAVVDALVNYYTYSRASVHRGIYPLMAEATELFESARNRVAAWLGSTPAQTIFTSGATAGINLVSHCWGRANLKPGDLVVVTEMEHHSNLVPWQLICAEREAELVYVPVLDDGHLDLEAYEQLLERGPKLVAVVHVSNVLGTINPVAEMTSRAHQAGAIVMIDGTQAVPHMRVDLQEIDPDFYAWTGHKFYGPTGIGVLHGRRELLEQMPPFISGGHMIRQVLAQSSTWAELPGKFEAGTSQVAEAIGLGAAIDYVSGVGIEAIRAHEQALTAELLVRLTEVPGLHIHGPASAAERGALVSFDIDGAHPHDIGEILGRDNVCVRTGHHCTQPLMRRLGISASTRASFGVYNCRADIDRLLDGLDNVGRVLDL